ncbi:MAG: hypothetical protein IJ174_02800 [Clostridia bacterium]|nr:hypothetical protein [Clostridia bacterium]
MKRIFAVLAILAMLFSSLAVADGDVWTCSTCGLSGNTGNFCPNCGSARTVYGWVCAYCGQSGNTGAYCVNCGRFYAPAQPAVTPLPQVQPTPTVVPAIALQVQKGDVITLGRYMGEAIRWQVLAVEGNKALLLSRYGLDTRNFHGHCAGQTWATSAMRDWLNSRFYQQAFTNAEAAAIEVTYVDESASQTSNSIPAKRTGDSTHDRIFLLSYREFMNYARNAQTRQCVPTTYALQQGSNYSDKTFLYGQPTCWWWLRTPAYSNNILVVSEKGDVDACVMNNAYGVVRPAMWVDLTKISLDTEILDFYSSFQPVSAPYGTPNPDAAMARFNTTPSPTPYYPFPTFITPTPKPTATPRPTATPMPQPTYTLNEHGTPTPAQQPTPAWRSMYQSIIASVSFFSGSRAISQNAKPAYALYDLDLDGSPELLIDNGEPLAANRKFYLCRTDENGAVLLLGEVATGDTAVYGLQNLPGVLTHSENAEGGTVAVEEHYMRVVNGMLSLRTVYETRKTQNGQEGWSDSEFAAMNPSVSAAMRFYTAQEAAADWNAFFASWY